MNKINSNHKKIFGVTLIELLIAMAISSILLVGVGSIYSNTKRTYFVQDEYGRLQENARYALDVLAKDIRSAGYTGCKSLSTLIPNSILQADTDAVGLDFSPENFILGHEITAGVSTPAFYDTPTNLVDGTHGVTIRRGGNCGGNVTEKTNPNAGGTANIKISSNCSFEKDEIVMVSDCESADIFKITNTPNNGINPRTLTHAKGTNNSNRLSKIYNDKASVFKLERNVYYIKTDATTGNPALYQQVVAGAGTAERLIADNVESMLIDYGLDLDYEQSVDYTNIGADAFLTAEEIEAAGTSATNNGAVYWANVVSVRIRLLMRSNEVSNRNRNYDWNGVAGIASTDYRIRQAYSVTVNLRNRTP